MKNRLFATLFAAIVLATAGPAAADPTPFVAGQKLDSGLGELPHYSKWLDRSGKNPTGEPQVLLSQASR